MTRRQLQIALGVLWLLAGVLQMQRFMFTTGFAEQVIAPAGQGQPVFVSAPVHWASTVVAAHPVVWNVAFASIQLLLGVGLLVPRTARLALAGSIAWALGVWYVGEGLGGIASGHASLLTGAPGSALLYGVLSAAAWPRDRTGRDAPPGWLPLAWAAVWVGGAIFQLLPGQNGGADVSSSVTGGTAGAPAWLVHMTDSAGRWASGGGLSIVVALATLELFVGLGVLVRAVRLPALVLGMALALDLWVVGQHLGGLYSGQATDLNSAPLLILMGAAIARPRPARQGSGTGASSRTRNNAAMSLCS
ncbi:MAG TPA: hypothetical protein VH247_01550 [Thermoleophilaceae bacterium]|nr:hypothetical protein [Thermoleophilaceae bacterium]